MEKYVYDKKYLEQYIRDFIDADFDDENPREYDEYIKLTGQVYGWVFESEMTGIIAAILSKSKDDLENITVQSVMEWQNKSNEAQSAKDYEFNANYYGQIVACTESDEIKELDNAVITDVPLYDLYLDIIASHPSYIGYADRITEAILGSRDVCVISHFLYTTEDYHFYPSCKIIPVKPWSSWRW